jgi:glutamate dehydrogenase/leucine dehydrogenase
MTALDLARELGHEDVLLVQDRASGLRAVIAIHDTTLGPAVGGTRMRLYPSLDEAAVDALRLSRAMTAKAALAEMPYGGGKAVILGDPAADKTPARLRAYARAVQRLDGRFHTGCDMGITPADVGVMAEETRHVSHAEDNGVGTAELAALGVLESVRAAARLLGLPLRGLRVAVQGLGQVGARLARGLRAEEARLVLTDVDRARLAALARELEAEVCAPDEVYGVECDVFSPNAAGGVLHDRSIEHLRCRAVVGAANEQLAEPRHGDALFARGILYAPDYVVNAGGLISLLFETGQTDAAGVRERVREIGPRVERLLERARAEGLPPHRLADRMVEERLGSAQGAHRGLARR